MTAKPIDAYFVGLEQSAREAGIAEEKFRQETVSRMKELERARAFAFRRLNLLRNLAKAMSGAEDEAEAIERGRATFLCEVNWTGASDSQREALEKFEPVLVALWKICGEEASTEDRAQVTRECDAFEKWFADNRNGPFLSLMEVEPVELPLVEAS